MESINENLLQRDRAFRNPMAQVIDGRTIKDLRAEDLEGFTRCHFFAGIAGWELALRLAGWPEEREVWTGSCPCQPFSTASPNRKGVGDARHLWPDFCRLIAECKPPTIFGEQVASKDGRLWLSGVRTDLEALGYAVGAADLCAAGIGAPHIRQRLYWVAHSKSDRWKQRRAESGRGVLECRCGESFGLSNARCTGIQCIGGPNQTSRKSSENEDQAQQRKRSGPDAGDNRSINGLSDADLSSEDRQSPGGQQQIRHEDGGNSEGLRDPEFVGCPGELRRGTGGESSDGRPRTTAWDNPWFRWADGTTRRIEPRISPLAHGVPARMGRLRGYGNAIVPQLAAEFIGAYLETEK